MYVNSQDMDILRLLDIRGGLSKYTNYEYAMLRRFFVLDMLPSLKQKVFGYYSNRARINLGYLLSTFCVVSGERFVPKELI